MKRQTLTLLLLSAITLMACQGGQSSSTKPSSGSDSKLPEDQVTIDVYSTNDIHGAVFEDNKYRAGIGKYMTYLKEKGDQPNTLLLDQGDTWQGSIYSNYNHGALITDVMNYVQYDARTVGNHDFDWGQEYITINKNRSYDGYTTPTLAGNVYDYDFKTKTIGTHQMSELGDKSVTYTLDNGVKVGILGGIGRHQITSISSNYVTNIAFTNHFEFVREEATHLRQDEHCDVVIASLHEGAEELVNSDLDKYVDLVLCGHTHKQESKMSNGVAFIQSYANTQSIGHTTLTYDFNEGKVVKTKIEFISGSDIKTDITLIEPVINDIIQTYKSETSAAASQEVVKTVNGTFGQTEEAPNLMAKAMLEASIAAGYNVKLAYVNQARSTLSSSSWTYADLYQAFPFDNEVCIMNITGEEFMNEIRYYNYICKNSTFTETTINPQATYQIACIDYLCYHTDENRVYDYFPDNGGNVVARLTNNYREILRDYLLDNYTTINASDFSSSLSQHDRTVYHV